MNTVLSHRFAAVACLAALAAPSGAAVTLVTNDSALTADIELTVPTENPAIHTASQSVDPVSAGSEVAEVPYTRYGGASDGASGWARAQMDLALNIVGGEFTGLSATSDGQNVLASSTPHGAGTEARANAVAALDVTFIVAPGQSYTYDLTVTSSSTQPIPVLPLMEMDAGLTGPSGTIVSEDWQAPNGTPSVKTYDGTLGEGTYQLTVTAETHAGQVLATIPEASTGGYDVQFTLTEVPEPTCAAILGVGAVLLARRRRRG